MAKENKPASAYAARAVEGLKGSSEPEYDRGTGAKLMDKLNISVGGACKGVYEPEEKKGIKMRGAGAATKGTMCRGPMA